MPKSNLQMSWASAIGLGARLENAAAEAAAQLAGENGVLRPDLAIVFASSAYGQAIDNLPQVLRSLLGDALLFGCNATGLIGGGMEEEQEPGIAILCGRMPEVSMSTLHLEQATLPPLISSREQWWRLLDIGPEAAASFVLLADPGTIDAESCARGLDRAYPGATVIGGLSSGAQSPGAARLLANEGLQRSGAMLLALTGNVVIDPVLAQGCKPIGDPLFVTACDNNLISELDGRRPKDLLTALFAELDETDRAGFGDSLCIGLALPGPRQSIGAGDFLIRNVLGLDPDSGALWVGARLAKNAVVQFHLRDGRAATRGTRSPSRRIAGGAAAADGGPALRLRRSRPHAVRRHRPRLRDAAPPDRHPGRRHVQRRRDRAGAGRDLPARILERIRPDPAAGQNGLPIALSGTVNPDATLRGRTGRAR